MSVKATLLDYIRKQNGHATDEQPMDNRQNGLKPEKNNRRLFGAIRYKMSNGFDEHQRTQNGYAVW